VDEVEVVLWIIAMVALSAASLRDLRDRLIPNELVLVVLSAAIGIRIENGLTAAGASVLATVIVAVIAYFLATREYIGWGDAKMIAAVSLLVPVRAVIPLVFDIVIAGGVLSCVYIIAWIGAGNRASVRLPTPASDTNLRRVDRLVRSEMERIAAHEPMPYALAILGGLSFWLLCQIR
jgi:prepilin peptidase CpaA